MAQRARERERETRGGRRRGGRTILILRLRKEWIGEGVRDRGPRDLNPTAETRARFELARGAVS